MHLSGPDSSPRQGAAVARRHAPKNLEFLEEHAMFRSLCTVAAAGATVLCITSLAYAQGRMGGMSSQSAFGSSSGLRPLGQAGFGATQFGSGFGSSGMSGFGSSGMGGMNSFGSGGVGSSFGGGGMGGMSSFGMQGMGGMNGGAMGGQNFVGRDGGDMNAVMSQMGRAGTQFFNSMSQNMRGRNNRNRQQQSGGEGEGENERPEMRIRLEVGFAAPRPAPTALARNIQTRIARLAVDHSLGRPQVSVEGDTVVLRGVAESESQSLVLANLIALEPGVRAVRNEMTIAQVPVAAVPAATTPAAPATAGTAPAAN
jgi:hypothetical protein